MKKTGVLLIGILIVLVSVGFVVGADSDIAPPNLCSLPGKIVSTSCNSHDRIGVEYGETITDKCGNQIGESEKEFILSECINGIFSQAICLQGLPDVFGNPQFYVSQIDYLCDYCIGLEENSKYGICRRIGSPSYKDGSFKCLSRESGEIKEFEFTQDDCTSKGDLQELAEMFCFNKGFDTLRNIEFGERCEIGLGNCGNGVCEDVCYAPQGNGDWNECIPENYINCPEDCSQPEPVCGDGKCDWICPPCEGEICSNQGCYWEDCPKDCGNTCTADSDCSGGNLCIKNLNTGKNYCYNGCSQEQSNKGCYTDRIDNAITCFCPEEEEEDEDSCYDKCKDEGGFLGFLTCFIRCLGGGDSETCSETDKGFDIFNKGTTTKGAMTGTDVCVNKERLTEYFCSNNKFLVKDAPCYNGCEGGACLSEGEINKGVIYVLGYLDSVRTVAVSLNDEIRFSLGEEHTVTIEELSNTQVLIEVASEVQESTLYRGTKRDFNLDGDEFYVKLVAILNNKSTLEIGPLGGEGDGDGGGDVCISVCSGKDCGVDGCGGSCGSCETGKVCEEGLCVVKEDGEPDVSCYDRGPGCYEICPACLPGMDCECECVCPAS